MPGTFFGYPAQVWQCCYNAIGTTAAALQSGDPIGSVAQIEATYDVPERHAAVQVWQTQNAWSGELISLREVESLALNLTTQDQIYFVNRIAALQSAIAAHGNYLPVLKPLQAQASITQGQPAISYPGALEGVLVSSFETVPTGLTAATLIAFAQTEADVWQRVAAAVQVVQGTNLTGAYDAAARMNAVAQATATALGSFQSGTFDGNQIAGASDPVTLWNQMVTVPSLLALAAVLSSPPNTSANQECGVIRFALGKVADQLALLILTLRKPAVNTINLAEIRTGDSLMDVAARNLGDFEQWSSIAALNKLQQPWVGIGSDTVAQYGSDILLPAANGSTAASAYPTLSYSVNVLGTDLNFGPLNGPMLSWSGDFETISGYANLSLAVGRRLQTPIGDLIYHPDYGSRIPPEVGAVQDQYDMRRLEIYASSAILSDNRVAGIASLSATGAANSSVQIVGIIQPVGYGATSVGVNATLSTLPLSVAG